MRKENPVRKRTEEQYAIIAEKQRLYRQTEAGKAATKAARERSLDIKLRLHEVHDADIVAELNPDIPYATQLKALIREAIAVKKALGK